MKEKYQCIISISISVICLCISIYWLTVAINGLGQKFLNFSLSIGYFIGALGFLLKYFELKSRNHKKDVK